MDVTPLTAELIRTSAVLAEREEVSMVTIDLEIDAADDAEMVEAWTCANPECRELHVRVYNDQDEEGHHYDEIRDFKMNEARELVEVHVPSFREMQRDLTVAVVAELGGSYSVEDVLAAFEHLGIALHRLPEDVAYPEA